MSFNTLSKPDIIAKYSTHTKDKLKDTGSTAVQIALLTQRINCKTSHLRANKKDQNANRFIIADVARRKKLLAYLKSRKPEEHQEILKSLNLRG